MKLEAVRAELRPRSDWEAVDLGLALTRQDFRALSAAWWLGMLPAVLLLPLMLEHPFWYGLLFWWWIPVGSRMVLFRLSRRLFGETPGWRDLLREFPRAVVRRFGYRMLWARLSPWRPLTMPVEDLEGLRGADYATRCRVLMRRGDSTVIILAMWRLFLTVWLTLTVFFTMLLFVPEGAAPEWQETLLLWWDGAGADPPASLVVGVAASLAVAMWLVDVFSVGAGFGIYLNYRTWIEGWDVELAFRRLANRLRGFTAAVVALLVLGAGDRLAAQVEEGPKERIGEVLAHEDFTIHKEKYRDYSGSSSSRGYSGPSPGGFLAVLGELVKFLAIGGAIFLLAWLIYRYRHVFGRRGGARAPKAPDPTRVVMGMDVAPESLPKDVPTRALELWRAGRRHEAMSLLYRASISWMIARGGVEIAESDTESDCLRRAREAGAGHLDFFQRLTGEWMQLAYAEQAPTDAAMEGLCGSWPYREGGVP